MQKEWMKCILDFACICLLLHTLPLKEYFCFRGTILPVDIASNFSLFFLILVIFIFFGWFQASRSKVNTTVQIVSARFTE